MAKRKLVESNARSAARNKVQEERSKVVGLAQKGLRANTDQEINQAAGRKGLDIPVDDTKARTTAIENKGKAARKGLPVSSPKKNLVDSLKAVNKVKVVNKNKVPSPSKTKAIPKKTKRTK